jgi:hypothetical protein
MALVYGAVKLRECLQTVNFLGNWPKKSTEMAVILRDAHFTLLPFIGMILCTLIVGAGILHVLLHTQQLYPWQTKNTARKKDTFPFMELYVLIAQNDSSADKNRPPELRTEVFQHLLDPPKNASNESTQKSRRPKVLIGFLKWSSMIGLRMRHAMERFWAIDGQETDSPTRTISRYLGIPWTNLSEVIERHKQQQKIRQSPTYQHVNNMTLVSKQFGSEFRAEYLNQTKLIFTLDASSPDTEAPLRIKEDLLRSLRSCQLMIFATPGLANAFDPRDARVRNWEWRDAVLLSMRRMTGLKSMTLTIQACGNQLWNPIWLWHFTSLAFKGSDIRAFNRMDFTIKGWPMLKNPNHIRRWAGNGWAWHCDSGHFVVEDMREEGDVRGFSHYIYDKCMTCEGENHKSSEEDTSNN